MSSCVIQGKVPSLLSWLGQRRQTSLYLYDKEHHCMQRAFSTICNSSWELAMYIQSNGPVYYHSQSILCVYDHILCIRACLLSNLVLIVYSITSYVKDSVSLTRSMHPLAG